METTPPREAHEYFSFTFELRDARTLYPAYRTWDFEVPAAGLYAFDIVTPNSRIKPAVREWLDGVQIAFSYKGRDYEAKSDGDGRMRRFRWLEAGRHTLDLYMHAATWCWYDDMVRLMETNGVKVICRSAGALPAARSESSPHLQEVVGFWQEGTDPDCMARVAGVPLVVAGCAANVSRRDAEAQRRFTMEVRAAHGRSVVSAAPSADVLVWSQTLTVSNTPVRFSYPCEREGVFKYLVRDADSGEVVEGPWDFTVTDLRREAVDGIRLQSNAIEVDRVDCTESAGGPHLFREGGKSEIVETPDGPYRLSGPQVCKTVWRRENPDHTWSPAEKGEDKAQRKIVHDWFAYTLKVEHPGRSHALVVRVPNDHRHFTSVVAYDRRSRLSNAWSIDSGEAPASGPWSEMKIPVWPNSDAIDVMVLSTDGASNTHFPHPDRRGAVAELSLLEYPDGFPPLEAPACGWNVTRDFGWAGEQTNLGPNERTMPPLPDDAAAQIWDPKKGAALYNGSAYHDWNDLFLTWDRTFELEAWRGGTTLVFPVNSYMMVLLQGRAQLLLPVGSDVYARECFGGEDERNPFDRDAFSLMLQCAQKHGVRLVADFMVARIQPHVVAAWAELFGMQGQTNGILLSKSADGSHFKTLSAGWGMLNPVHPLARKAQVEFCREFGRRYGKYESFAGINHRFWGNWPTSFEPWFVDADTGFDDFTVGEFSKATGIALAPVLGDEAAFDARKRRLQGEYSKEWNAWRAEVCRSLQEEMLAALREGAPRARFFTGNWRPTSKDEAIFLPEVFEGRRDLGFDDAQVYLRGPGVEINHLDPLFFSNFWVHVPVEAGGHRSPVLPPPTGLCCNNSYRSSPYHLEPAALALADNRLDQFWAGGMWCLPPLDDALRDFVRAYRAIPDRADWRRAEAGPSANYSPVALRWAQEGGDALFWAVNRTDATRKVVLRFEKEPTALEDCVSGGKIAFASGSLEVSEKVSTTQKLQDSKTPSSESNNTCEIALSPFMPGVFRAKGAGALLSYEVPVESAEAEQIERDFAFIASLHGEPPSPAAVATSATLPPTSGGAAHGEPPSPAAVSWAGSPCPQEGVPVEVRPHSGRTYCTEAGTLGKLDQRFTFADLFTPMREAHDVGDLHALRALVQDFRTNHRWWFEAFGWPEDLCVVRNVGREPLVAFLRQKEPTELWLGESDGVSTADFSATYPQIKGEFVCAPQGVALDLFRKGQTGFRHLELTALFGGGYGDIRVEDGEGELLGVVNAGEGLTQSPQSSQSEREGMESSWTSRTLREAKPRLETRVLPVPLAMKREPLHVRLVGTGEKGLAIQRLDFVLAPQRPVTVWQAIGPFDKGGGEEDAESYAKTFPPETEPFYPDAEYEGLYGRKVRWRTVALADGERVLDLAKATPCDISKQNAVSYLRAIVRVPRRMVVSLYYTSDWYGSIFVNRKPLVEAMAGPKGRYEKKAVWMEKGDNEVLVRTSAGRGSWHFGLAADDCGELEFPLEAAASSEGER